MKDGKQIDNPAPCNNKKTYALKLGTWNVQTMTPGFSDNLHEIDNVCKTAVIDMELSWLQMDIIALQEMRLPVKEKKISFFWQGKLLNETGDMVLALRLEILC